MPSAELAVGIANLPNQRYISLHFAKIPCLRGKINFFLLGIKLSRKEVLLLLLCLLVIIPPHDST